jgi:hypothetical protein
MPGAHDTAKRRVLAKEAPMLSPLIALSRLLSLLCIVIAAAATSVRADVVTDWNQVLLPIATSYSLSAPSYRDMAMVHLAMFGCINAIEPRYQPYRTRFEADPSASKNAAAAVAAARVMSRLHPDAAPKIEPELANYLARIPEGSAKSAGIALGEKVADSVLASRVNDGSDAADSYRPRTTPGRYVPTAPVVFPAWGKVTPFALASPSQFRPGPPLALTSREWAANYNEIREIGGKNSTKRTALQTETGRLWLYTGPGTFFPLVVQLSAAKGLGVDENARLFALVAMATADAMIAVFDAKYEYEFWRPITAIRNGDQDDNPDTERDATWEPLGPTPMHPEYPCAHCIVAAAAGTVMQSAFGTGALSEFTLTTPTAPGVTHRWTRLQDYIDEPSNARIWSGIHYRFSTEVGADMGRKIAEYTLRNYLRPLR